MAHLQLQCRSGVSWHEHKSAQLAAAPDGSAVARHRKSKRDATEISFQGLLDDLAHAMIKPMHALDSDGRSLLCIKHEVSQVCR